MRVLVHPRCINAPRFGFVMKRCFPPRPRRVKSENFKRKVSRLKVLLGSNETIEAPAKRSDFQHVWRVFRVMINCT